MLFQDGLNSQHRHDQSAWTSGDTLRAQNPPHLGWTGAVIEYGGDWPEVAAVRGLKSFRHGCMDCSCKHGEWDQMDGVSLTSFPFEMLTQKYMSKR